MIALENQRILQMSLDCLRQTCLVPSLRLTPTSEEEIERKKSRTKRAPKSSLTAALEGWLLSILQCRLLVISVAPFFLFPGDAETISGVCGNEDVSAGVEIDGQLGGRHIVVAKSLVPLAGGTSMMSLRLSTVEVGARSCWIGQLMMVIFVFK